MMGWYDWFSNLYDDAIERHYVEHRQLASAALELCAGQRVLDVPCGTGQSFPHLVSGVGEAGAVIGIDASRGMLRKAAGRLRREGWANVRLLEGDAAKVSASEFQGGAVDRLHIFLGMSVFDDMERTFTQLWSLLIPGGRCVIVDVHEARPGLQGKLVNLIAGADIRRRFWEPLEGVCDAFERRDLPYDAKHGGQIMLATGVKAAAS